MFFVMGINDRREDIDFTQTVICDVCGSYGRYNVFMICSVLTLFFIPVFKWNKRYYVEMSCCHTLYELNSETAEALIYGEINEIRPEDLILIKQNNHSYKKCTYCGYETEEDFEFCPKCGNRF